MCLTLPVLGAPVDYCRALLGGMVVFIWVVATSELSVGDRVLVGGCG